MTTTLVEETTHGRPALTGSLVRTWFILLPLLYYANSGFPGAADTASAASFSLTHQIGLLIVCVIAATFIFKRFGVVFAASLKNKLIILLPVIAVLSSLWSFYPRQSITSAITLFCFTLFVLYLSVTYTLDGQLDLVMLSGAIAVTASIAIAILIPSVGTLGGSWRGIFTHKQQCAAAVTLFLVTALHWKSHIRLLRFLHPFYILLCVFLIGMSQSRTGWGLAVFALVLSGTLWLLQRAPGKDALFVTFTAIPVVAALSYIFAVHSADILALLGKDPTLSQRTVIWGTVWDAIVQRPLLGYGYEAFWQGLAGPSKDIAMIAGWPIAQAQNGYLDLMLQFGFVGIATVALMSGQAALNILRVFRRSTNPPFVRWCIVVIVCNFIYNVGESDFGYLRILWLLFVMACIGLNKEANALKEKAREAVPEWGAALAGKSSGALSPGISTKAESQVPQSITW